MLTTLCLLTSLMTVRPSAPQHSAGPTPEMALKSLMEGNKRFVTARLLHPHQDSGRRGSVAKKQHPFAVVLTCADSRVPPELVFDQGLGDLFVLRVAGNIADDAVLGSIEYAVEHLGAHLIVVLGHERCGAVDAAVKGGEAPGHIGALVTAIQPAVESTKAAKGDRLDAAVRANVALVVKQIRTTAPLLKELAEKKSIRVIGGRYDLDSGKVELLKP